jgi:EamA domain-containing membrane protein RarD
MRIDQLLANRFLINTTVKGFGIIFSVIYVLFAVVVYKQIQVMNKTLETKWGRLILLMSFGQIVFSLIVFSYAVLFL